MAFTEAQKKDIRKYLGVPFGFYTLTTRLESMMDLVGGNATDSTQVIDWLGELAMIDAKLGVTDSSSNFAYGALKKADEVEFYDRSGTSTSGAPSFAERGNTLIQRIARSLGVSDVLPIGNYFSPAKTKDDRLMLG